MAFSGEPHRNRRASLTRREVWRDLVRGGTVAHALVGDGVEAAGELFHERHHIPIVRNVRPHSRAGWRTANTCLRRRFETVEDQVAYAERGAEGHERFDTPFGVPAKRLIGHHRSK